MKDVPLQVMRDFTNVIEMKTLVGQREVVVEGGDFLGFGDFGGAFFADHFLTFSESDFDCIMRYWEIKSLI